ncbi:hypothetical protein [Actinoplanes couchii]|uniref:DUF4288 domain-containing protein n=1 Tax=Actinoplanes couchii TaxID=403638 RepID=A0ABQ3X886_9ACTN|nr:hypothetical protein [Actinoplanes couchii]MDR6320255.1 hypothetical protein [Actinoplanes couchii]GID54730.1 hypothetical protein Aco03nite_031340 [Actinoplanes couchii]
MDDQEAWYSVRCVFRLTEFRTYEERITLWRASSPEQAVNLAESEAAEYASDVAGEYLGLAQVYAMDAGPEHGAELFSLLRDSPLPPTAYLDTHFDTGTERQGAVESS